MIIQFESRRTRRTSYSEGLWEGFGTIELKDGFIYEGHFEDGEIAGKGKAHFNNNDGYNGELYEGNAHGPGTYKWSDGSIHEGTFAFGQRSGPGALVKLNGDRFDCQWINDMPAGRTVYQKIDGPRVRGKWDDWGESIKPLQFVNNGRHSSEPLSDLEMA